MIEKNNSGSDVYSLNLQEIFEKKKRRIKVSAVQR
jgi:hypothetical protein